MTIETRYLICDGGHGAGTSTHADALAAALRTLGYDALAFHHPAHPAGAVGLARVDHYIAARAVLRRSPPAAVVILDRGPLSGVVYARSLVDEGWLRVAAGLSTAAGDAAFAWHDLATVVLDAPDEVLNARLVARGEDPSLSWSERCAWRELAAREGWRVVDTGRPREDVTAELVAWAVGRLT